MRKQATVLAIFWTRYQTLPSQSYQCNSADHGSR